ncbi:MAG: hypothetical protein M3O71_08100 [Bacteroidota bacterium]|nr:hypothetical protein [Bacteroidota bacterium]
MLVSSGQPSLNPRLVKEADALSDAGYTVTVLYAYWNDWGTELDKKLLPSKKWKAQCVGGDPEQKSSLYFISRLINKLSQSVAKKKSKTFFTEFAISRSSFFLIREAKKHNADLYIAHNLGALPAVVKAAKHAKAKCGFDAEDFHRQEVNDDTNSFHYKLCKLIEDKYLPQADYITGSSPLIARQYELLYNRLVPVLSNVFPKVIPSPVVNNNKDKPLKLFWFSQTIGPSRGLELIIDAIGSTKIAMELHLLGKPVDGYKGQLIQLAATAGINASMFYFYDPVPGEEIFKLAPKFDIGIASETGFCLNNKSALSNKLFTYLGCGLAVIASNTPAQSGLLNEYPQAGKIYNDAAELTAILTQYHQNRELLFKTKNDALTVGQTELNWEIEGAKFLKIVADTLAN